MSAQDISKFWRKQIVQKLAIAALPVLAAFSQVTQSLDLLVVFAVVIPILILAGNVLAAPAPGNRGFERRGVGALKQHVQEVLDNSAAVDRSACILLELEQKPLVEREWGASVVDLIHGEMAARIGVMMRRTDNVFLLDQGLIGLCLDDIRSPELNSVISLIERLQAGISQPIPLDGTEIYVSAAAGFCLDDRATSKTPDAIFEAANLALAEANRAENGAIRAYSKHTPTANDSATKMQADVVAALEAGQIIPWFQPQISTDTGQVTGFEALARWKHPDHGMVPPSEFIPLLERAGRMEDLSEAILNHALQAVASWDKAGFDVPSVSVNFATQELRNPGLVERIKWDVDRFELDPKRVTVEILETVISETEDDVVTRNIRELGSQGFGIDLDDFGTGHATLANIQRFKVDRIKIDRSFVARSDEDPEQQRMIAAIVGMAERLEIETIAEGVETIGEQSLLSQLGCAHLQGFGIARPMPFEDTLGWMADYQTTLKTPRLLSRKTG